MNPDFVGTVYGMPTAFGFGIQEKEDGRDAVALSTVTASDQVRAAVHFPVPPTFRMGLQLPVLNELIHHFTGTVVGGLHLAVWNVPHGMGLRKRIRPQQSRPAWPPSTQWPKPASMRSR